MNMSINEARGPGSPSAKTMTAAATKVFNNIYKDVKSRRNSDFSKIFMLVQQGANAPGKLPLDPAATELIPWVEDVTVEMEGGGNALLFSDTDILDVAYDVAERLLDALRKDGLITKPGMREGKSFRDFRKQLDEQTYDLREGAVKAAMEDWIESLPKAVVDEINKKYADKLKKAELTGLSKGDPVRKALIALLNKHNVKPALGDPSRDLDISALEMMFVTMLGEGAAKKADDEVEEETIDETDSRMYGDDAVVSGMKGGKGKPKPKPCKGKDCEEKSKSKPFMGYEATETMPSESDLMIWYKATGASTPFDGAVPTYSNLKRMWKGAKKEGGKAWDMWTNLVKKGKVQESAEVQEGKAIAYDPEAYYAQYENGIVGPYESEDDAWNDTGGDVDWIKQGKDLTAKEKKQLKETVSEAKVKVALNPNKKIGYQVVDVGPGGKRTVSKSENFPEVIIQVRSTRTQTLYSYGGKYYIVSYAALVNETAIFLADQNGKPLSYEDLWSEKGGVEPDSAIKQYLAWKFKKDFQVKLS
jgi:DNA-binding transcriptional ArsR family regulator